MNVYKKLQAARVALQGTALKKSGNNKFAGYNYFELGDFLPTINDLFHKEGLCSVVSFGPELATLRVIDTEDGSSVEFTSPMGSASLKGCHEVQNIGAVETYQRRYLYVTALEIVEHDALEAVTGDPKQDKRPAAKSGNVESLPINKAQVARLRDSLERVGLSESALLAKCKADSIETIPADTYERAMSWINRHADQEAAS